MDGVSQPGLTMPAVAGRLGRVVRRHSVALPDGLVRELAPDSETPQQKPEFQPAFSDKEPLLGRLTLWLGKRSRR